MRLPLVRPTALLLAILLSVSGCYMRVRISSGEDSPDGTLRAAVVAHTAPGEGYDERKRKDVYVSIYRVGVEPTQYVFKTELPIVAAELDWQIRWRTSDSLIIEFYERKTPRSIIKSMTISRIGPDGSFREVR